MSLGLKKIETRPWGASWARRFNGPLVICATASWNREVLERLAYAMRHPEIHDDWQRMIEVLREAGYTSLGKLPLGSAVCIVYVTGSLPTETLTGISSDERAFGNFDRERVALFTDPAKLVRLNPPIPVKGRQGLWEFNESLLNDSFSTAAQK